MEFEDVLSQVGDFGKFQKFLIYFFLIPTSIINVIFDCMFMLTTPDHWCNVPQLAHLPMDVQKKMISPMTISQGLPAYDKCRMYDIDYNIYLNTSISFNGTSLVNQTKECDNGWLYDKSIFEATATTQFDLVCDKAHYVSLIISMGSLATVIMTPIYSALTDWVGRKRSFLYVMILTVVSTFSPIILRDMTSFLIARIIAAGLWVIFYQIPFILTMEFVGVDYRSQASTLSAIGYSIGSAIIPWAAYLTGNWVWLSVSQLSTTIPLFIFWRYLPESASWLIAQERYEEAVDVMKRAARINGKEAPADLMIQLKKVGAKQQEIKKSEKKDSIWDLIKIPELRKQTIIIIFLFSCNNVSYIGLNLNTLNFHGNEFMNYFLLALADIPGMAFGWFLIQGRLGRRWTNTIALTICGVSLCVPVWLDPSQKTWIVIMSMLGKAGTACSYMISYQQSAEIFPTTLRSEGMGICSAISALTAVLVPHISYLGRYGLWIPMFIAGMLCLMAGMTSSFLPETHNENLPQNSADSQKFGKNKSYFCLANTHKPDQIKSHQNTK